MQHIDTLMIGCGELGSDVATRLAQAGRSVAAIRRNAHLVPAGVTGISADLTTSAPSLPSMELDLVIVALAASPRTEQAYRATYVDGMSRALDAISATGSQPRRAVLVSSTGVYGRLADGTWADENTEPGPRDAPADVLAEAETVFTQWSDQAIVVRLSGLYGSERPRLLDRMQSSHAPDEHLWTNRIHRSDAAAAVEHVATAAVPPGVYVGNDDEPAQLGDVAAYLRTGEVRASDPDLGTGKRLSNRALRATGWAPQFATYREGYARWAGKLTP